MFMKSAAVSFLGLVAACASLTEDACRSGNWESIGYNDGVRGRAASYINEHRDACGEYGIQPNTSIWSRARIEGLKQYCTPDNAYVVGRRGNELNNVCPTSERSELQLANFFGLRYYEINREVDALEDDVSEIELILATNFTGELTPEQIQLQNFYLSQIINLQKTIRQLERESWKYAALP